MGVNIGNKILKDAYIGNKPIKKIYLGNKLLWQKYDAEIEYLEGGLTQYIDTGMNGDSNLGIDIKGTFFGSQCHMCGCVDTGNTRCCSILYYQPTEIQFGYGNYYNLSTRTNLSTFSLQAIRNSNEVTIIITVGTTITQYTKNVTPFDSNRSFFLFRNNGGSSTYRNNTRIHYCKIYYNNSIVRDYIPVRVGQVGYMYDKVSGQLFGNDGTGDFILGNDI